MTTAAVAETIHKGRASSSPFAQFDQAPDTAYVRVQTVADLLAIDRATVWRWAAAGRLPKPVKLGPQTSAWQVGALRQALASLSAAG